MIAGFTSDQIYERDFVYVMTDKHQSECAHIAPQELRSFGRVQARNKTKYFKAYGSELPMHKIFVLQCTLKTAYKKLMIRNIKTSEVIVINRKLK